MTTWDKIVAPCYYTAIFRPAPVQDPVKAIFVNLHLYYFVPAPIFSREQIAKHWAFCIGSKNTPFSLDFTLVSIVSKGESLGRFVLFCL